MSQLRLKREDVLFWSLYSCFGLVCVIGCASPQLTTDDIDRNLHPIKETSDSIETTFDTVPALDDPGQSFLIVIDDVVVRNVSREDGSAGLSIVGAVTIGVDEITREKARMTAPNLSDAQLSAIAQKVPARTYRGILNMSMVLLNLDAVLSLASKTNDQIVQDRTRALLSALLKGNHVRFAAIVLPNRVVTGSLVLRSEGKIRLNQAFR